MLLLLVATAAVALTLSRPGAAPQPTRQQLDEAAVEACEVFEPAASQVRAGELEGEPLYRVLQDVYNQGVRSQTPGFAEQVTALNTAGINGDEQTVRSGVLSLQLTCQQRRG